GACVQCKTHKMKCEFEGDSESCKRCLIAAQPCLSRDRKKRKTAPTQEELEEQSFAQDRQIKMILLQLQEIEDEFRCRRLVELAHPSAGPLKGQATIACFSTGETRSNCSGRCVNVGYLGRSRITPPSIVKFCALFPDEILELFHLYFETVNTSFSVLEPIYHHPARLLSISPFLFTVVIALASRHYKKRDLHGIAMEFAKNAAGKALIDAPKTIETCQAFLLLAVYPIQHKRLYEDRSWIFMGVAFSLGRELGLHLPPETAVPAREQLNRTRAWLNCFCLDISYSMQTAKTSMMSADDYIARTSRDWYMSSPMNIAWDIQLCWYAHILSVVLEYRTEVALRQQQGEEFDIITTALHYDQQFCEICELWEKRFSAHPESHGDQLFKHLKMVAAYLRLVVLSHGFQHGPRLAVTRDSYITILKSITCARTAIQVMTRSLFPTGRLRFALESYFLFAAFSAAFLINLLNADLYFTFQDVHEGNIALIQELIQILGSSQAAVNERHTPALYSRFLSTLLEKYVGRRPIQTSSLEITIPASQITPTGGPSQSNVMQSTPWRPTEATLDFDMEGFLGLTGEGISCTYKQKRAIQDYVAVQSGAIYPELATEGPRDPPGGDREFGVILGAGQNLLESYLGSMHASGGFTY
ncbi:hypothetical protein HYDPIDRAFT_90630, partial [Hydnomerulius pinastri MD-312]